MEAPRPENEAERLAALRSFSILDSEPEEGFDDLVYIASEVCGTPIALVTLVDDERQWFKARVGLDVSETPRTVAFCAHAILRDEPFIVPDATVDERFRDNPLVTGPPEIRFYAGTPLTTEEGHNLGTICVIDTEPRKGSSLTVAQRRVLAALSRQTTRLMHCRREALLPGSTPSNDQPTGAFVSVCAWCARIRGADSSWLPISGYLRQRFGLDTTHGICPDCLRANPE